MTEQTTPPTLYAGKFKTIEELEAGYNNAAKVYQENEDLKGKYDSVTKVPDEYAVPQGVNLHDNDLARIKIAAKQSGLTQAQFDKLAQAETANVQSKLDAFENAKKEVGADNLNLLDNFLKSTYPEKIAEKMLKEAIKDKDLRDQLLEQRTKTLNSTVPGSSKVTSGSYNDVTHDDLHKAREAMLKTRGKARVEAQKKYVSLAARLAHKAE